MNLGQVNKSANQASLVQEIFKLHAISAEVKLLIIYQALIDMQVGWGHRLFKCKSNECYKIQVFRCVIKYIESNFAHRLRPNDFFSLVLITLKMVQKNKLQRGAKVKSGNEIFFNLHKSLLHHFLSQHIKMFQESIAAYH